MPVCEIDLRPGGSWHFVWRKSDGAEMEMCGVYREITPPERLVSTESWGGPWPETLNTLLLTEEKGKTTATIKILYPSPEARDAALKTGMKEGMAASFDRLAERLETMDTSAGLSTTEPQEFVTTRVFDAPRELVWRAWTDPKHLAQWWGPHRFTNPVCEVDVRPGGAIRIHMRGPDGTVYPMTGVYREVVEPERLVFASAALDPEGNPLFEVLNTLVFTEQGRKTTLRLQARVIKSTAFAAQHLKGMDAGWTQSLERLAAQLTKMSAP